MGLDIAGAIALLTRCICIYASRPVLLVQDLGRSPPLQSAEDILAALTGLSFSPSTKQLRGKKANDIHHSSSAGGRKGTSVSTWRRRSFVQEMHTVFICIRPYFRHSVCARSSRYTVLERVATEKNREEVIKLCGYAAQQTTLSEETTLAGKQQESSCEEVTGVSKRARQDGFTAWPGKTGRKAIPSTC